MNFDDVEEIIEEGKFKNAIYAKNKKALEDRFAELEALLK